MAFCSRGSGADCVSACSFIAIDALPFRIALSTLAGRLKMHDCALAGIVREDFELQCADLLRGMP